MIYVGVTGWGDHDSLYTGLTNKRDRLKEYSGHFPIVELDASFYAVQPKRNVEKWLKETPESFQFIVKAYQGMTGHQRGEIPFETVKDMFEAFIDSVRPIHESGKLAMVLFQFPPWFDCKKENVDYIRYCKSMMGDMPCAIEFRHQSWYRPEFRERTLAFIRDENWIHSICDEPQAGEGSVPTVLEAVNPERTLIRLHGRNFHGWNKPNGDNWREVRYLYRYNKEELLEWKNNIGVLKNQTKDLYVLFNNNSGGDAADNAKQFIELMDIEYQGLASRQLDIFD
ncbi:DUF72 domain-containing protein [Falsibacillus pallidus]|uniref:Uncharacterized protein YecE (DUF72 family) n=1 Tax=Falsibacillus pallidus TaxID=493781 RepID=A0A370GC97_9BACI|nr:DUF72 domain-containing protein [Falsibacillus pallidus]RDI41445.1 uncharacterized protein YecE (DUF72 family) [Falsibacillus pallidus]